MAIVTWVEGDTSPRPFVLSENGAAVDLTDATVLVILRSTVPTRTGPPMRTIPVEVVSPAEGKVTCVGGSLLVAEAPYNVRFRVTKGNTTSYFPYPQPDSWVVIA